MPKVFGPPENMVTSGVQTTAGEYNNKQLFEANDSMAMTEEYSRISSAKKWEQTNNKNDLDQFVMDDQLLSS